MNNYESMLEKYGPKSVEVEILGDKFLVKKLSAADAERLKMYGMEVSLSDDNKPEMSIVKDEWQDRPMLIVQKCLQFPDGTPCFETSEQVGALGSEFVDAAYKECIDVNDLSAVATEEAEKN